HKAGLSPDTIRFLRFPPTVLVGRHQAISHEVKLEHVRSNGIGLVRRITGGGAIYLDEGQLGWELVFHRKSLPLGSLGAYTKVICEAVASGLSDEFGIRAKFRPRNDIEVEGRKLCGTGGFFDGDTLIYQGTVLVDMDPQAMVACLNVPEAKLKKRALDSAAQRVVTLNGLLEETPEISDIQRAILGGLERGLGVRPEWGEIDAQEEAEAEHAYEQEIGQDEFVFSINDPDRVHILSGSTTGAGGTVTAHVRLEGPRQDRIREILFTGDFFITPPRLVFDLEASLRGVPAAEGRKAIQSFFESYGTDMSTVAPADFCAALKAAIDKRPSDSSISA
ncbi:MAG: lipoate--protein ligase family protein, partial [Methyloligellaceae bacterium]